MFLWQIDYQFKRNYYTMIFDPNAIIGSQHYTIRILGRGVREICIKVHRLRWAMWLMDPFFYEKKRQSPQSLAFFYCNAGLDQEGFEARFISKYIGKSLNMHRKCTGKLQFLEHRYVEYHGCLKGSCWFWPFKIW